MNYPKSAGREHTVSLENPISGYFSRMPFVLLCNYRTIINKIVSSFLEYMDMIYDVVNDIKCIINFVICISRWILKEKRDRTI